MRWQGAADDEEHHSSPGRVIVDNLVQEQIRIKVETSKWSGLKLVTRQGNSILV